MEDLFSSGDCSRWRACLDRYDEIMAHIESSKKRNNRSDNLTLLDKWYQEELPASIASRDRPHLTHEELCRLMEWKLTRGKFRPRLRELVRQNSAEDVEETTAAAIAALPDLEKSVTLATRLSAIGPATASAILCAACHDVPFMADEAALSVVPSLGKLTYTLKQYLQYASLLQEKARGLSSTGDKVWTAHEVELALWTHHHSTRLTSARQPALGKRSRERPALTNDTEPPSASQPATHKKAKVSNSP